MPRTKKQAEPEIEHDRGVPVEATVIKLREFVEGVDYFNFSKMRKDIDLLLSIHAEEIRYASLRNNISLKGTSLEDGVSNWLEKFHEGLGE